MLVVVVVGRSRSSSRSRSSGATRRRPPRRPCRTDPEGGRREHRRHASTQFKRLARRRPRRVRAAADLRGRHRRKLLGVTIVTDERDGGRTFTITGKEGQRRQERVDDRRSTATCSWSARDGMTARTEHATYADARRHRPRARAGRVHARPDDGHRRRHDLRQERGRADDSRPGRRAHRAGRAGRRRASDVTRRHGRRSRAASRYVRFDRGVQDRARRPDHRGRRRRRAPDAPTRSTSRRSSCTATSRITTPKAGAGGLQALTGRDMNLKYARRRRGARARAGHRRRVDPAGRRGRQAGAADRGRARSTSRWRRTARRRPR